MKKTYFNTFATLVFAGIITFVGNASASDDYDVRAFGPKSPIVWNIPIKASFSHSVHTDDAGLECSSCHGEIFAMQRGTAVKTGRFNMKSIAAGEFCGTCHDGDTAFASDTNCKACHIAPNNQIVWTKPVKAVVFQHGVHTEEYGLECDACHNETFTMKLGVAEQSPNFTMKALYDGQYCGKCHDGETAFASNTLCNNCHIGVKGYNRLVGSAPHASAPEDPTGGH